MHLAILTFRPKNQITFNKQINFLERLARLLTKQYTIKQALEFMRYDPQLNEIANRFSTLLQKGHTIDYCFKHLAFHPLVISFMHFSKESGHLSEHLTNCNRMLRMKLELQKKLKDVLKYPLFLTITSLFIFIGMNVYLMPIFTNTFESFGDLDSLHIFQLIIKAINIFFILAMIALCMLLISIFYIRQIPIDKKLELIHKIPYISQFYRLIVSMQFSYQLFALLDSGKNIQEALHLLKEQKELKTVQYYSNHMLNQLAYGKSLYDSMNELLLIQNEMKWLIKRSDEQGTLTQDLRNYANLLIETIEENARKIITMVQPIFYLIIGVLVITIYILTLFPIYQLMQQI